MIIPLPGQQEQHRVYLAIPGNQYCWGTVTGVVNSTADHIARPFSGGPGFSGQEDFNILWTDAYNMFQKGEITHFAMMHGDITPDPSQRWLDILLEEMDARNATLVSSVSPIKDPRGVVSSGILDPDDEWMPWKRFTLKEIHALPETFNNVDAGYPDKALLHNTALWVCDLRKPVFQKLNERGELDMYFGFPTRAFRQPDGTLVHQRMSEDWLFSRHLWERGIRDTYITRKTRLTHHGKADFPNSRVWGEYQDGDENTAHKWRAKADADKPLALLQIIDFELGRKCNLGHEHDACPNTHPQRFSLLDTQKEMGDDLIVQSAVAAYQTLGFSGLIGFHYYNEPLLQKDRLFRIAGRILEHAPKARFLLWTNGMLIPENVDQFKLFSQIVVSGYNEESARGRDRLLRAGIKPIYIDNATLDDRIQTLTPRDRSASCLRPFLEMIFDAYGNTHLCCYDWKGEGTTGNLHTTPIDVLAAKWRETLPKITGDTMASDAPSVCLNCHSRQDKYQVHDNGIVQRAREWRAANSQPINTVST